MKNYLNYNHLQYLKPFLFDSNCEVTILIDFNIISFIPVIITIPSSIPSGLSCDSLIVTAGKLRIEDSSVIVPLSDITQ